MEHIEVLDTRREPAGIIPKPSDQTIAETSPRPAADQWQSAPTWNHGRTQSGGGDLDGDNPRKYLQQHVANQIHAVPSFLPKVANHTDADRFHARAFTRGSRSTSSRSAPSMRSFRTLQRVNQCRQVAFHGEARRYLACACSQCCVMFGIV